MKRITYDLLSPERAEFVVNSLLFAMDEGVGAEVDGSRVKLTARQVRLLAALPEDDDGHIDTDGRMWIGGTEFPPARLDLEREIARALAYGYFPNALAEGGELQWRDDLERDHPHYMENVDRRYKARVVAAHLRRLGMGADTQAVVERPGLHLTTRQIPTTGLALPTPDGNGEVFVPHGTLCSLAEVTAMDLAFFGGAPADAWVDHAAGQALVAAGLAAQSARGSYYGTDALKALLQEV